MTTAAIINTHQTLGLAYELANRIVAMSAAPVPPRALRWARMGILDTLGVTMAGHAEPAPALAARPLDLSEGPSLLLGTRRRIGALDAALITGTASHALD